MSNESPAPMSFTADRLLLFGATGDLAQRMLLPSLCALEADKLLDPKIEIVCTARSAHDTASYRNFARAALEKFLPAERRGSVATFLNRLTYQPLDASKSEGFDDLAKAVGTPQQGLAIFLSTAPSLFEPTIKGLAQSGLAGRDVRITFLQLPAVGWTVVLDAPGAPAIAAAPAPLRLVDAETLAATVVASRASDPDPDRTGLANLLRRASHLVVDLGAQLQHLELPRVVVGARGSRTVVVDAWSKVAD